MLLNLHHPYLETHKSNKLFNKYFKYGASTFSMEIISDKKSTIEWMKSFKNASYKTSFGSAEHKFDSFPTILAKDKTLIRLTIGYEANIDLLIEELKEKLIK